MKQFYAISLLLLSFQAIAEDTLVTVLERMRSTTAIKLAYQETRFMDMLDQPWHGRGFMYSVPGNIMIKEQTEPEKILMAIIDDKMFYYDIDNDIRHQGKLDEDNPMSLNIAVFKALMSADRKLLEQFYHIDFIPGETHWEIILSDKNNPDSNFKIIIQGPAGQAANHIVIQQDEDDKSVLKLSQTATDSSVEQYIQALLKQLESQ